jgi:arabinose-5-phosphate isomerase
MEIESRQERNVAPTVSANERPTKEDLLDAVREVIRVEADALRLLVGLVDDSFTSALELMATRTGKIVVTGVGKSGLIARKIAATLTSTGTIAVFLHPADGMHGDLGGVTSADVVLAIGKSGESEELVVLIPAIKQIGAKIIAITATADSRLAKGADVTLLTPVKKEACPLNLAPTVSTTLALAVGDALAVALMKLKNFRPEDFARYHPGGKLGKRLLLRVCDLMTPIEKCPRLDAEGAKMEDVILALSEFGLGVVLFMKDGTLRGILTDGDIRRLLQAHRTRIFEVPVAEMMNVSPLTIPADFMAVEALKFMEDRERPLNLVPVVDAGAVVGVLRLHDLVAVS